MSYDTLINFLVLFFLETVLGVDNLIFLSLIVNDSPKQLQRRVQILGLSIALLIRVCLIFSIMKIISLSHIIVFWEFSFKDLLLILGGTFLLFKSIKALCNDITHSREDSEKQKINRLSSKTFFNLVVQIILVDLVFSIDSIISAIGITYSFTVIVLAFVASMLIMVLLSNYVISLINNYYELKTIAITFVLFVGLMLICEGFHLTINRNCLYCSLIFSLIVESMNIIKERKNPN